jgi:hypothetical protein
MNTKALIKALHKEYAKKKSELEKVAFAIGTISGLLGLGKAHQARRKIKRKMSAAARKKIGEAVKARWAKRKAAQK